MKWFKRRKHKKEDTPESGTIPDPMSYGSEEISEGPTDELQAPHVDEPGPYGAPEALGREDQNETEAAASWEQTEEDRPGIREIFYQVYVIVIGDFNDYFFDQ